VRDDEQGGQVGLTVALPDTPQITAVVSSPSRKGQSKTWREDGQGRPVDLTVVRPSTPLQIAHNRSRVEFAPQTTRHPCSRPTSARPRTLPPPQQSARYSSIFYRNV